MSILLAFFLYAQSAHEESGVRPKTDLCRKGETVEFSCEFSNKKYVSMCSSHAEPDEHLAYRFGKIDRVELSHEGIEGKGNGFFYEAYSRYRMGYFALGFVRGGYEYKVQYRFDEDELEPKYGLTVSPSDQSKEGFMLPCTSHIKKGSLGMKKNFDCDAKEMVGCDE